MEQQSPKRSKIVQGSDCADSLRSGRDSKADFSIAFSDNTAESADDALEQTPPERDLSARKVIPRDDSDESKNSQNDLAMVVGASLERVALLAARGGRWELAGRTLAELQRRGLGAEVAAEVAAIAAEHGEWAVAETALLAVSGG